MMKMEIKLDEERIRRDGKYDVAELWKMIDKEFVNACTKEVQPDGAVMYVGIPDKDYYTEINVAIMILEDKDWFAQYCVKWVWFDNDDDENLPFNKEDVLSYKRLNNSLFRRWN